jgi:hypothetical protein
MNINQFVELGYLQELNRQFLHPLGIALLVIKDSNGNHTLHAIQDCRDDIEGIIFNDDGDNNLRVLKENYIKEQTRIREKSRMAKLGFYIQPILSPY